MVAVDDINVRGCRNSSCLFYTRRTTPEKFFIEACDDGSVDVLAIDRVSTEMTLTGKHMLSLHM